MTSSFVLLKREVHEALELGTWPFILSIMLILIFCTKAACVSVQLQILANYCVRACDVQPSPSPFPSPLKGKCPLDRPLAQLCRVGPC